VIERIEKEPDERRFTVADVPLAVDLGR